MKKTTLLLLLVNLLGTPVALSQPLASNEIKKLVDSYMTTHQIGAVALSLIHNGGHEEAYFGSATAQTLFEIGSITKVFTPHLMTIAEEEGKVSIHNPISQYILTLKSNPVFNQITLKDLATHTSALPAYYDSPNHLKSKQELMQWLLQWKPTFPPKTQYLYSNVGIALIGFILESVYHQDWDQLLNQKILLPRKMNSTYQFVPKEKKALIAQGFDSQHKPANLLSDNWIFYPAGILKTNASDLGSYVASWDESFFKALKEAVCFSNHSCQGLGIEAHPLSDLSTSHVINLFTVNKLPGAEVKTEERVPSLNELFIDKTGSSDGMSAYVGMIPRSRVGVAILCNQWNVSDRVTLGRKILSLLEKTPSDSLGLQKKKRGTLRF